MKFTEEKLPSNTRFGSFFSGIFLFLALYFFYISNNYYLVIFGLLFAITSFTTLFFSDLLAPLNTLWMRIGYLIGGVVSPIVMGAIFFLFFTPIALIFKLIKRDYLRLKYHYENSYWIARSQSTIDPDSFKNQF